MKKSTLILITLCLVFSVNIFVFAEEKAPSPNISPTGSAGLNVVMIVLDACRADHLGCYGYTRATSPNIDQLANESILFEQAYAQGIITFVSFSSFLTGKYPITLNAYWDGRNKKPQFLPLQQSELTLAEILRTHNYSTVAFPTGSNLNPEFGLSQGFQIYTNNPNFDLSKKQSVDYEFVRTRQRNGQSIRSPIWSFQETLPLTLKYLKSVKSEPKGTSSSEPFFLLAHTNDTHPPYDNPPEFAHKFDNDYLGHVCQDKKLIVDIHRNYVRNGTFIIQKKISRSDASPNIEEIILSDRDIAHIIAHYDGGVAYADDCVGRILKQLTDSGLDQNTIVVIMSDHGDGLGERGYFGRGGVRDGRDNGLRLPEELCRVPLIIRLPPALKSTLRKEFIPPEAGQSSFRISQPVQLVDLMPTILDFLDIKPPADIDGISLKELMLNNAPLPKERPIVTEGMPNRLAFRINNWKLIQKEGDSALYNLKDDPGEKNNLTDNPATKEIQESLLKKLRDWQKKQLLKRGYETNDPEPNIGEDKKPHSPDALPVPPPIPNIPK